MFWFLPETLCCACTFPFLPFPCLERRGLRRRNYRHSQLDDTHPSRQFHYFDIHSQHRPLPTHPQHPHPAKKETTYASGIREARKKGLQEKDALINAATEEEKAIIDKINAEALAELNAVKEKVAKEVDVARGALLKDVDSFASEIGVKILGRAV